MAQTTGGHWLDTGDGLTSVDPLVSEPAKAAGEAEAEAPPTGRAIERPSQAAWRKHIEHQKNCGQCSNSVFRCAAGNRRWQTYLDVSR